MKHIIAAYDQHELGLKSSKDSMVNRERTAVRAVAFNEEGQIALIEFTKLGSRKLPGGGVDAGEDLEAALKREVREEIGYEVAHIIKELGIVDERRYFSQLHQVSYCYLIRVGTYVGTEPTEKEKRYGIVTRWYNGIDEAIKHIRQSTGIDEDGDKIGRIMMNLRDVAILQAAKAVRGER